MSSSSSSSKLSTTLISSLQSLPHLSLPQTQQLHSLLITTNLLRSSPQPTTALISAYSRLRLRSLSLSSFLFSPHPPNLFHFNALISSLSSLRLPHLALRFFSLLRSHPHLRPDHFTYPPSVNSCPSLRPLQSLHSDALKLGLAPDRFVASALVRSYLELGFFDHARNLFGELPDRDVVLWNAMVTGFARKGEFGAALECFRWMGREGVAPSVFTVTGVLSVFTAVVDIWGGRKVHGFVVKAGFGKGVAVGNALVDFYGKCHEVGDAERVFVGMEERDLLTWNSMASAFQYNAEHGETLRLVGRMRKCGVMPDAITLAAVLPACSQTAALMHGREIHNYLITSGISFSNNVFVFNALMDMYAKSGVLLDARHLFDSTPSRDNASWNILIHGYASHGLASDALNLFNTMCLAGEAPDEVTFVGLLSACSHSGLVEHGQNIFYRMESEFGVVPTMEHYSCMVDLFGRAGQLKEAKEMAEQANEPGIWRAYQAACKNHGKTEQVVEAAERVVGLEPKGSGGYVLLANAYGLVGKFGEVEEVRGAMWRQQVRKVVGCSWVEVRDLGAHTFVNGDRDHPEVKRVYNTLNGLVWQMREVSYTPDVLILGK